MNNSSKISIDIFRVSSDSNYLDMIFNCPEDYYFTSLSIEVRHAEGGIFKSAFFDLSEALFELSDGTTIKDKYSWAVRLPLDKLGINYPAIYIGSLKITPKTTADCPCNDPNNMCLLDTMVCSDLTHAYKCLLDGIISKDACEELSDDIVRKYLLIYGHLAALNAGDMETAELYFKLISNCFECEKRQYTPSSKSCNCRS